MSSLRQFFAIFAYGASLPLFAPKISILLQHPVLKLTAETFWPFLGIIVLSVNTVIVWLAVKYANSKEKKFMLTLLGIISVFSTMIVIARADNTIVTEFDYRYAGGTFYAYCIFLTLAFSIFYRTNKTLATKIVIPVVIIIFSAQQAFSFQSGYTREAAIMRKDAIVKINKTLLSELESLAVQKKDGALTVPNLSGDHLFQQTMAGYDLAYYMEFFQRSSRIQVVQKGGTVPSYHSNILFSVPNVQASTSPEFLSALVTSKSLQSYYFSPSSAEPSAIPDIGKTVPIREKTFDPKKLHFVSFTLVTDDTPGNVLISFTFKNDFNVDYPTEQIKVTDYDSYEKENGKRIYHFETDMQRSYAFSLSQEISHLELIVPKTKNATVSNIVLQ